MSKEYTYVPCMSLKLSATYKWDTSEHDPRRIFFFLKLIYKNVLSYGTYMSLCLQGCQKAGNKQSCYSLVVSYLSHAGCKVVECMLLVHLVVTTMLHACTTE